MDTLEELQYIPIKDDIRQRISSFYGVSNVFMNDVSGGGLNNEGMQIVVTNRALAASQNLYNMRLFPLLLDALQITEYHMKLSPHEEEDEIMLMRKDEMMIRNMMQMKQAGFDATMRDDTSAGINFDYKEAPPAPAAAPNGAPPADGSAPVQTSDWVMPPTMDDILKRTVTDSNRGDRGPVPGSLMSTFNNDIPALRLVGNNSQIALNRRGSGRSPAHVKRHEGSPTQASSLGDSRDFRSPEEVNADKKIKDLDDRLGID